MSWLSDRLKEAEAQLNFRDGGKTASTVRAARAKAPPAQTTRKQNPIVGAFKSGINTASRAYDQVNPLDNGRSFKTRDVNPLRQNDSALLQAGRIAKPFVKAPAQMLNTVAAQIPQVDYTIRQAIAAQTGNNEAYQNATRNLEAANDTFNQGQGGLFNAGTFYNANDARRGDLKTGLTKIGGGTLQTAATVAPVTKGGTVTTMLGKRPLAQKAGLLAGEGAVYGAGFSTGQQLQDTGTVNPAQLARDTALGTVANVAIPAAGMVAGRAAPIIARKTGEAAAGKPFRNVSDQEVEALQRVQMRLNGYGDDIANVQPQDAAIYRQVQQKLGVDVSDTKAIDDLIGARQTYRTRLEQAGGLPQMIDQRINPAGLQLGASTKRVRSGLADDLSPEQTEFIKDYAEMLKGVGQGNGVDILPDGRRVSNNMRSAENKGKAMTNDDWFQQARKDIESGKAGFGASDEYATLPQKPLDIPEGFSTAADVPTKSKAPVQPEAQIPTKVLPGEGTSLPDSTTKASRFANKSVQGSDELSSELKTSVRQNKTAYQATTNEQRIAQSDALLSKGKKKAYTDVNERLNAKDIDDQTVSDAIAVIKDLDSKPGTAALQQATDLVDKLSEKLSNAGKTVQAASLLANRTPEGLRYHAQRQFKNNGVKVTPEIQKQLKSYTDSVKQAETVLAQKRRALERAEGTPRAVDARAALKAAEENVAIARDNVQYFVAKQLPTTTSDKVVNLWRSGLLTAPTTTGGAGIGNAAMTLSRKLWVNPAATMTDFALSLVTGKRSYTLAKQGEWQKGVKRGAKNATSGQFWKTGYDPMNPYASADSMGTTSRTINYGDGRLGKATGAYVNGVYKLMGAADQPFRYGAYDEILSSMAKAEAKNKGLSGAAAAKYVDDAIANPSTQLKSKATEEAMAATFQNPTGLATLVQSAKRGLKQAGYHKGAALVDYLIPFAGVPSAVADRAIRHSGIKAGIEVTRAIIKARKGEAWNQRALAQYIGEGTIGLPVVAAGYALGEAGLFNGAYPKDPKERQKWTDENRQENSVKIGDRWYSLNYIQPFGVLLSLGAGISQTEGEDGKEAKIADYVQNGAGSALKSFAGQSYLEGLQGPIDFLNAPEDNAGRLAAGTASSSVPNFIRSFARATDDKTRDVSGIVDGVKGAIPGLRGSLPAKVGSDGQELPNKDNFLNMYVNPTKPSKARENNPVVAETSRLLSKDEGVSAAPVKKLDFGETTVKLDKNQQNAYNKQLGKLRNQQWGALIKTDEYKAMTDDEKSKALQRASSDVNAVVKQQFAADNQVGPYAPDYTGKEQKLTARQQALAGGETDVTSYLNTGSSSGTSVKGDKRGTALIATVDSLGDKKKDWTSKPLDSKYKDLYTRSTQIVPKGLPELPQTNATLAAYAKYLKTKAKGGSELKLNDAKKDFLKEAYTSNVSENARELYSTSYTVNDKIDAISNGSISADELKAAIEHDNFLITSGLSGSAKISNTIRRTFGYGKAPKTGSSSGGGSGGSSKASANSYKLYGGLDYSPGSYNQSLRNIVKAATL